MRHGGDYTFGEILALGGALMVVFAAAEYLTGYQNLLQRPAAWGVLMFLVMAGIRILDERHGRRPLSWIRIALNGLVAAMAAFLAGLVLPWILY